MNATIEEILQYLGEATVKVCKMESEINTLNTEIAMLKSKLEDQKQPVQGSNLEVVGE